MYLVHVSLLMVLRLLESPLPLLLLGVLKVRCPRLRMEGVPELWLERG